MRMVKTPNWPADRFKALIDRILDEADLNKAQLAAMVGMNPSQISRWTNGSGRPKFESLVPLGKALQDRYPSLKIGPAELAAAAGYSTEPELEDPASLNDFATAEAKAVAAEPAENIDLSTFVPQTATEKALLALLQASLEARERSIELSIDRRLEEINEKIDRLADRGDDGDNQERKLA